MKTLHNLLLDILDMLRALKDSIDYLTTAINKNRRG